MRRVLCCLLLMLAVWVPGAAQADAGPAERVRELRFAPGHTSVTVRDSVVRGEVHYWRFTARAGQQASLGVSALEKNAALQVWRPGAKRPTQPGDDIEGSSLPGAGADDDAQAWDGALPDSGSYLVVVGATRGNASYKLTLKISP